MSFEQTRYVDAVVYFCVAQQQRQQQQQLDATVTELNRHQSEQPSLKFNSILLASLDISGTSDGLRVALRPTSLRLVVVIAVQTDQCLATWSKRSDSNFLRLFIRNLTPALNWSTNYRPTSGLDPGQKRASDRRSSFIMGRGLIHGCRGPDTRRDIIMISVEVESFETHLIASSPAFEILKTSYGCQVSVTVCLSLTTEHLLDSTDCWTSPLLRSIFRRFNWIDSRLSAICPTIISCPTIFDGKRIEFHSVQSEQMLFLIYI